LPVRRTPLGLNLFFLLMALVAAMDGFTGAPIGLPGNHPAVVGGHPGGGAPWLVLNAILDDDDERSAPETGHRGASSAPPACPFVCPTPPLSHGRRIALPADPVPPILFVSAAPPRGPPRVS
jgi:hypothetical protein